MIEIYLLEQLNAFAKEGTLTGAAEKLHISQPALTRSMKKIEEEFGFPLFTRDKRKLTLNACGKIAAGYAERILEEEERMRQETAVENQRQNVLDIGSCSYIAINRIHPLLQQSFPHMSILNEAVSDDDILLERLRNHTCQIAVLHEMPQGFSVFSQQLMSEHVCICVPETHPLSEKKVLHTEDLKGLSILAFQIPFWLKRFEKEVPEAMLMPQTDMDVMDQLVESRDLFVFNSDRMLEEGYIVEGKVPVPVDEPYAEAVYYVSCLDAEKERYSSFFNAIRAQAIR